MPKCDQHHCDHEAALMMQGFGFNRRSRWRMLCTCCAALWEVMLTAGGAQYITKDIDPNAITVNDVDAARAALKNYEGDITALFS